MSNAQIRRPLAIVVGAQGQDGTYLTARLQGSGYEVIGIGRTASKRDMVTLAHLDILDSEAVCALVAETRPERVFHLAAYHHSSEAAQPDISELVRRSLQVNVGSLLHFLEAIRRHSPTTRLFYAASSRIFGEPPESPQTERTPIAPLCPYGISKAAGLNLCRYYRRDAGLYASVGILYNHESPRRTPQFITRRLVLDALAAKRGELSRLEVGNLSAVVDWGYAPDFIDAFIRILDLPHADDFIVATGVPRTVADLIAEIRTAVQLDDIIPVIDQHLRLSASQASAHHLIGDSTKLRVATGWNPTHTLSDIVRIMVSEELGHASQSV